MNSIKTTRHIWGLARQIADLAGGTPRDVIDGQAPQGLRALNAKQQAITAATLRLRLAGLEAPGGCTTAQWLKVRAMQRELHWDDKNLRGFIQHTCKVEHENFLTTASARQLITGLTQLAASKKTA